MAVRRTLWLVLALVAATLFLPGCFVVDRDHNMKHVMSFTHDMERIHDTTDKYIFNYDKENPWQN